MTTRTGPGAGAGEGAGEGDGVTTVGAGLGAAVDEHPAASSAAAAALHQFVITARERVVSRRVSGAAGHARIRRPLHAVCPVFPARLMVGGDRRSRWRVVAERRTCRRGHAL